MAAIECTRSGKEPKDEFYPGDKKLADDRTFHEAFGSRGVIRSYASGKLTSH